MSEETVIKKDPAAGTAVKPENAARQQTSRLAFMRFLTPVLLGLAVAGGGYFLVQKFNDLDQNYNVTLDGFSRKLDAARQVMEEIQTQQKKLGENIEELAGQQNRFREEINVLSAGKNDTNLEWALSEIEYLLIIANHRLILENDVTTALTAMQAALARLKNLPGPDLLVVRKQLIADINKLQAVTTIDIPGLALYLADLASRVDGLPLKATSLVRKSSESTTKPRLDKKPVWWKELLSSIWLELKDVIIISRESDAAVISLLPAQQYYLKQNLRLELESAKFAVLRRDTEDFRVSIEMINDWLGKYYDQSSNAVSNMVDSLQQMSGLELRPEIPDISSSLETLRFYLKESSLPETDINYGNNTEQ